MYFVRNCGAFLAQAQLGQHSLLARDSAHSSGNKINIFDFIIFVHYKDDIFEALKH